MPFNCNQSAALFQCHNCGKCCHGYGGTYLTKLDIEAIARYIKADPNRFVDSYCCLSGDKPLLAQGEDGYCIFWDQLCTIHPVKPLMCRKWPFLESILVDPANWLTMAGSCPGIQTDVDPQTLQNVVRQMILLNWDC